MVRELVELLYAFDVSAYDGLLFLKNTDVPVDLGIAELVVVEVAEGCRDLVLAFVVEQNVESACDVINLELSPHGLLNAAQETANQDDVVYGVAVKLANVVRTWLRVHDHADSHRCKHL